MRKWQGRARCEEKKGELFLSHTALSLTREFACHSIMERLLLGHKFFSIRRVRYSLSQFVLEIPRKNSSYS